MDSLAPRLSNTVNESQCVEFLLPRSYTWVRGPTSKIHIMTTGVSESQSIGSYLVVDRSIWT